MGEIVVFKKALHVVRKYQIIFPSGQNQSKFFMLRFYLIVIISFAPSLIGDLLYLRRISTKDKVSLVALLESIQINVELLAAGLAGFIIVFHGKEVGEFLYHLGIHKFAEPEGLTELYMRQDKVSNYILSFTRVTIVGRILYNISENTFCQAKQMFNDERYLCGLLIPCWFPFKINMFLKCWIIAGSDLILGVYLPVAALAYYIGFGISDLIVLRMQKMKSMLEALDFEGNEEIIKTQLQECIKYHFELWDLIKMMNNNLGNTHVVQYSFVSGIIALLEYELTVSFNIPVLFQLIIWIGGEYMLCSAGQNIENEREAMAITLYLTPWYKLPVKLRKTFELFLAKMQMPLHFEARPMIHLNYEFLMKVLKGSYTFLMFLKSV